MEFIQCPHCQKKYAANDQLRAAAGKKIRCKHCSETFEIALQQASAPPNSDVPPSFDATPLPQKKPTATSNSSDADIKKTAPQAKQTTKKKLNIQLLITIVLLIVLIAGAIAAYLFLKQSSLFDASAKKDVQHIIPQQLIKPLDIQLPTAKPERAIKTIEKQPVKERSKTPAPFKKPIAKTIAPINPTLEQQYVSQVCKDIAADYWMRSHKLATTSMDTASFMKLLDQNMEQADEIRKRCKQKGLISDITTAARTDQKPAWIAAEIRSRISASQQDTKPDQK